MSSLRRINFSTVMLVLGLLFLYLPMFVLVVYSFNASKLVTVWAGFSTQWYGELFRDEQILSAVWTSLRIAFFAASMAVCLGTVAAVVVAARLREVDHSIEEAAMDLGSPPVKTFFSITLPIITPALAAGWLLAFTLSLDDLVIASFVSGPGANTLPMVVFSSVRMGVSPKINALATLIILIVSLATLLAWFFMRRNETKRKAALQDV